MNFASMVIALREWPPRSKTGRGFRLVQLRALPAIYPPFFFTFISRRRIFCSPADRHLMAKQRFPVDFPLAVSGISLSSTKQEGII
ncbi:hypothetical protein PO124_23770 [Bacillus licheniformis]|nr:hypothetical protein [Bacillus licheniformis]